MDSLLKIELVNIIFFLHFFMEAFPCDMDAFNLGLHICQHLKRHTILKKKEKRFGRIHLLTQASEAHYG